MRVYVACSSNDSVFLEYKELATDIASILAKRGHKLIFNGKETGMVGKVFMTFKFEEGHTKAIVDVKDTDDLEVLDVDAYEVTATTFQKRERMFKSAELIVILPGGVETIADLFGMLEEVVKRKLDIRIVLFDYKGFYKHIIEFIKTSYNKNFISRNELQKIDFITDIDSFERYINKFENGNKEEEEDE